MPRHAAPHPSLPYYPPTSRRSSTAQLRPSHVRQVSVPTHPSPVRQYALPVRGCTWGHPNVRARWGKRPQRHTPRLPTAAPQEGSSAPRLPPLPPGPPVTTTPPAALQVIGRTPRPQQGGQAFTVPHPTLSRTTPLAATLLYPSYHHPTGRVCRYTCVPSGRVRTSHMVSCPGKRGKQGRSPLGGSKAPIPPHPVRPGPSLAARAAGWGGRGHWPYLLGGGGGRGDRGGLHAARRASEVVIVVVRANGCTETRVRPGVRVCR